MVLMMSDISCMQEGFVDETNTALDCNLVIYDPAIIMTMQTAIAIYPLGISQGLLGKH